MICDLTTSIFDSKAECLVNAVNCEGIMGRGIALEFKARFPDNFRIYADLCKSWIVKPGSIVSVTHPNMSVRIINAATKDRWMMPSELRWAQQCVLAIRDEVGLRGIKSIAIPALGCGLGGLRWQDVRPMLIKAFEYVDCHVELYGPQ